MSNLRRHAFLGTIVLTVCQLSTAQEQPRYFFGPDEPFELVGEIGNSGIHAGGWTQAGYTTDGNNNVGTGLFNSRPNEIVLNSQWFYLEKTADPTEGRWDWGFRFDGMYGTDAQDTQAFGGRRHEWDNQWDNGSDYGWALPQAYVDVACEKVNIRVGHFFKLAGYEVVMAPDNFFYSHSYTMYNAEPFTHTGVLATFHANDRTTVYGGWTAGWNTGFTRNHGSSFLGGVSVQVSDEISATYTVTAGDFGNGANSTGANGSDTNGYAHSIVVDVALTKKLNLVLQSDHVDNTKYVGRGGKVSGINSYLLLDVCDKLGVGARVEYFDTDGQISSRYAVMGNPFTRGSVFATTIGANVQAAANLTIRPELRYERIDGFGVRDQLLFGIDAVLTF